MADMNGSSISRRMVLATGAVAATAALTRSSLFAKPHDSVAPARIAAPSGVPARAAAPASLDPALLRSALAALGRHGSMIRHRDRIAIVDFAAPSARPRFHFLNVENGETSKLLVAHGSGSDPGHTGFLHSFSNREGSNASSEGAFITGGYYTGKHGRSQRLVGLDPTNDNALDRAIVIHGAWYADAGMIATHGKLGRSQGCFAVGESDLDRVFGQLGEGRMIYAAKV